MIVLRKEKARPDMQEAKRQIGETDSRGQDVAYLRTSQR